VTIPQDRLRNFSIIAHIDHGKSTLADRLLELTHTIEGRQMMSQVLDSMDLEREKGITIKARAVRLEYTARDGLTYGLNLIDTPGHVDFAYEVSHSLQACEGAILVVDATQGIEAQTLANVHLALRENLTLIPVLNKIDLPSADPETIMDELENVLAIPREEVILASAKDGTGVPEILEAIVARIPAPKGDPAAPVKGLIFDSHYDAYKGVIVYVRLAAGTLRQHDQIRLMASGAVAEPLELGVFRPQLVPVDRLVAGGVPSRAITLRNYTPDGPRTFATIRLNYPKITAVAGPCGLWPDDLGPNIDNPAYNENKPYHNFGCATQRNLAAMVANPADLEQPRAETPAYNPRRDIAFDRYRKGVPTTTV
jgi:GTP-binding protein LepA